MEASTSVLLFFFSLTLLYEKMKNEKMTLYVLHNDQHLCFTYLQIYKMAEIRRNKSCIQVSQRNTQVTRRKIRLTQCMKQNNAA